MLVAGRDTRTHRPRDLADVVGFVGQDPLSGFVTDIVEDELAYGMESLGLPADVMRRRVEETLDLLGLAAVSPAGEPLGRVAAIENYGAGDILEIELSDGRRAMVPMSTDAVPEWDHARVVIDPAFLA